VSRDSPKARRSARRRVFVAASADSGLSIKHATSTHMEGARAMIQVTERARETFKNKLELIERPDVMLRLGRMDSGLGVFPDTLKDDDQIIEHDGRVVLVIDHEVSETLADRTIDVEEHADGAHFVVRR
jgi:Fe-S cluster assembly iron-binding protein IscA